MSKSGLSEVVPELWLEVGRSVNFLGLRANMRVSAINALLFSSDVQVARFRLEYGWKIC